MSKHILKLIKIGERKFMEKLLFNGDIYMNHIDFFRENDFGDFSRGDFAEGFKWSPFNNLKIKISDNRKLILNNVKIKKYVDTTHIYSMFMLDESFWMENKKIDKKINKLGDTALIIDPKYFTERILKSSKEIIGYNYVNYYDTLNIPQELNIYSKRKGFGFQNEFRFAAISEKKCAIEFSVGSIEDIAILVPTESLFSITFNPLPTR